MGIQWFARGGNIKRCGPFKTQADAVKALRLTNDRGFPADAFVWPEEGGDEEGSAQVTCPASTHARMKADPQLFLSCAFTGYITLDGVPLVMCRDCVRCKATLGLRLATVVEMYPLASAAIEQLVQEYVYDQSC